LILVAMVFWATDTRGESATWLITCDRLFDGVSDNVADGVQVLVKDGIIVEAGSDIDSPPEAEEIRLSETTLLPGLIDAHTHITYSWADTTSPPQSLYTYLDYPALVVLQAAIDAKKTLDAGFTTIRDMGSADENDLALAQGIARGLVPGPRILTSGPLYMPWGGGRADIDWPPYGGVGNREEIVKKTRTYISAGCDWIKMYCTSGTFDDTTGVPYFTAEEIKAAVDVAHPRGRWVAAHTMGYEGARRSVAAGVRSIEHGSRLDGPTVKQMARKGIYLVPTLYHLDWYERHGDALGYGAGYAERLRALQEIQFDSVARARKAGVPIACGSDAIYSMHGENAQEVVWLVRAGLTPIEALRSATSVNAELLGLEEEIGRIAPGYAADLVAVPGDPSADITQVTRPVFVMQGGKVIHRP
jgi:imidazolonepropionase-like amidohydrolase